MPTTGPQYVIGDVQGCYDEFMLLNKRLPPNVDIILSGDIVNRGNKSLQMLKWAESHNAKTVIGNHDIHLIAAASGIRKQKSTDTIGEILASDNKEILIDWLRFQPLVRFIKSEFTESLIVHAGVLPSWTLEFILDLASEIECKLQGKNYEKFLRRVYEKCPKFWTNNLKKMDVLVFGMNVLTRLRYCTLAGDPNYKFDDHPSNAPPSLLPWFQMQDRQTSNVQIVAGHWSTLGLYIDNNVAMIDTGAVYGGQLTALLLSKSANAKSIIQVPCKQYSFV